jgi:peptidoglycan hydrolase-like protein with peptidoglycan-binding domain
VAALEQRLGALHYDVGQADDAYDANTASAVVAFQKIAGLPRTGRATPDVVAALATATVPPPLVAGGGPTRVEIDLARQVLFLYQGDALARILPVSTGSGKRYCDQGHCGVAVTPGGAFRVERRISGWRKSDLGRLFNPLYFTDGIAIHGFPSVPSQPASHGCVRISMTAAGSFPQQVPDGTPVYVLDGKTVPAPLGPGP